MSPQLPRIGLRGPNLSRPEASGRTVLIGAMCLFLVVVLASPLQNYLSRRAAVANSLHQQAELHTQVEQLQQELALWNDPAYVARQARGRLNYVRPGDTLYTVIGATQGSAESGSGQLKAAGSVQRQSWNVSLWNSVLDASKAQ